MFWKRKVDTSARGKGLLGIKKPLDKSWSFINFNLMNLSVLHRKAQQFFLIFWGMGLAFVVSGCIESIDNASDLCLNVPVVEAEGIKRVYFGPFQNQQSASDQDTVVVENFGFNLELDLLIEATDLPDPFFSSTNRIACQGVYTIRNISNIAVVLLEPFADLPAGTDISYLLLTPSGQSIAQLREFNRVSVYIGARLNFNPEKISQLRTRTFLFLRDGTRVFLDSTSPFLKPR